MTVEEIIEIAQISQFKAANDIASGGLYTGGGAYKRLPRHLYLVRKNVERLYDLDPNDDTLTGTANYLLALCGKYRFAAQAVTGGGGTIAPSTGGGGTSSTVLDFEVSASTIIPTGGTQIYFNGEDGRPDFRGLQLNFSRGGVTQNTTSLGDGSNYYAWNPVSGLFSIYAAAQVGELFRIMPDNAGTSSSSSPYTPDTIILDADGTYTLANGQMIWKITINPSAADTVRIGTSANGEQIMMDKLMTINTLVGNGVTADVFAESGDVTIYFTGFTAAATINIYTLPI